MHYRHKGRYGYRRIIKELEKRGFSHNPKTINRLMNEMDLKCLVRLKKILLLQRKSWVHCLKRHSARFSRKKMHQKWVTDVTEFHLFGEKRYLSHILDLCNGEIITYKVMKRPVYQLVDDRLKQAVKAIKIGRSRLTLPNEQVSEYIRGAWYHAKHVLQGELFGQRSHGEFLWLIKVGVVLPARV
nr:IS3 family transposase [Bacillus badius]